MIKVSKLILKNTANKLMFDMADEDYDALVVEFSCLIKQVEEMENLPGFDSAKPMSFPYEVTTSYLRDDVPTSPLLQEDALKNASDVVVGQIRLPKVIKK